MVTMTAGMDMDDGRRPQGRTISKSEYVKLGLVLLVIAVLAAILGGWALGSTFHKCPDSKADEDDDYGFWKKDPKQSIDVRLPRDVLPTRYDVRLLPFIWPGNFTFHGEVSIVIDVQKATNKIAVHAVDLDIWRNMTRVQLVTNTSDKKPLAIKSQYNDTVKQLHVIELEQDLMAGEHYVVYMKFIGNLNDYLQGFYRSSYTVSPGVTRWIAATQFQPTDARRAFPCFDEPEFKAMFEIHIARPTNMTAISNMPVVNTTNDVWGMPNYVWDHFAISKRMSTYLVAFIVSDFDRLQSSSNENVRVWARKSAIDQAPYALEIAPKILKYYEDFFGQNFPLPKIDMVALPDFSAGAMENWGLITYRETALLYQERVSTSNNKQRVATVVAHELAHQWFGNLVTPSWWSDLWLNEGFASYVENIGINAVEPSWKALDQFVVHELQSVFGLDALESSHPISVEVGNPDEINEIFDRISYSKGASIIRMMEHFLTTEVFKSGLSDYLRQYAYKSAQQDDLWQVLTKHANEAKVLQPQVGTVKDIMDKWTLQTGFPVINVVRNYQDNTVHITQERYTLANKSREDMPLWYIPLTFTYPSALNFTATKTQIWMTEEKMEIPFLAKPKEWVIFNIMQTGYYRVNYDETNWAKIIEQLQHHTFTKIGTINRAQLVDDALNLARAGRLNYGTALDVMSYLKHETEYLPWKSALVAMSFLDSMLVKFQGYDLFRKYALGLLDKVYNEIGFTERPNDSQLTIFTRIDVLTWACMYGHPNCILNAAEQFKKWQNSDDPNRKNPIDPNLKSVVYCTALRIGREEEWNFVWQRYKESNVGSEKDLLLYALGCTRDTWLLSRYLDWGVTENSGIRKQDVTRVFGSVASNIIGQPLAFNYIRERWDKLRAYFGTSILTINNIVKVSTRRINTKYELRDLREFEKEHRGELGSATRTVEQAVEQGEVNIKWLERNHDSILKWLQENVGNGTQF